MAGVPRPQEIYKHFKGNLYQILSLAEHTETGEMLVIYQALYGEFKIYARPLSMFMEKVDKEKYKDALQEYRFELYHPEEAEQEKQKTGKEEGRADKPKAQDVRKMQEIQETQNASEEDSSCENAGEEAYQIDPLVLEFLDAASYEERLNILAALHHRITDDMINTMAIAVDVEVNEGDIEQRYEELKQSLLLFDKFECSRLR